MSSWALERCLVEYGAATLAGLKTASLFCVSAEGEWRDQLALWKDFLLGKGLVLLELAVQGERALLYLYRPSQLERDLRQPGVGELLAEYGYSTLEVQEAVARLGQRLAAGNGFPHEIGLFLGYPLGDVKGFIRHGGKHCKCAGCWKVYCNEGEARRRFAKLEKCREVYLRLYRQGRTVHQMTVAA